ncbi:hypothetical protein DCE79_05875 [Lysinibacillus sp. 2017]|nr:hypothetical protein DCE79_05875 [Lysinibacillus sp. 2017]TGN37440.1 hypothetical protein E4L99_01130 [Lysinibacillus sp. S2017]
MDASYNLKIDEGYKHCKGEKHYLTFFLAIYPGMRRGELLGVNWSDIDLVNKTIHIQRSLQRVLML